MHSTQPKYLRGHLTEKVRDMHLSCILEWRKALGTGKNSACQQHQPFP